MCCVSQFWLSRDCKTDMKIKPETASVGSLERNSSAVPFFISLLWTVVPVNGKFPTPSLSTRYLILGLFSYNKTVFMLVKFCVQSAKHKTDHSDIFLCLTKWLLSFNNFFLKHVLCTISLSSLIYFTFFLFIFNFSLLMGVKGGQEILIHHFRFHCGTEPVCKLFPPSSFPCREKVAV